MFQWIRWILLVSIHWCALIWSRFAFRDFDIFYNVPMPVLAHTCTVVSKFVHSSWSLICT
jgi:hypothetical protein